MPQHQRKQSCSPMWRHGEVVHTPQPVRRASGSPGRYDLVVIAASAGGVKALEQLLSALPADFPVPIAIVQHRTARAPNLLAQVLSRHTSLVVKNAEQSEQMHPGTVYLAPQISTSPSARTIALPSPTAIGSGTSCRRRTRCLPRQPQCSATG